MNNQNENKIIPIENNEIVNTQYNKRLLDIYEKSKSISNEEGEISPFIIMGDKLLKEYKIVDLISILNKKFNNLIQRIMFKFNIGENLLIHLLEDFQEWNYTLNETVMLLKIAYAKYDYELTSTKVNNIRKLFLTKSKMKQIKQKENLLNDDFEEITFYVRVAGKVIRENYYYKKDLEIYPILKETIKNFNNLNNPNVIILNKEKKEIIFNNDIILGTLYIAQSLSLNYKIAPEKYKNLDGNKIFHEALDKCEELKNLVFPKRNTTPDDPEKIKFYMNEIKKQLLKIDDEKWERNPLKQLNKEGIYLESQLDEQKKMNFKIITKNNISFFLIKNIRDAENIIEKYLKVINKLLSI